MGFRLLLYLFILLIGAFIGYKDFLNKKIYKKLNLIQTLCLLFLLFVMGIRMGLDDRVIQSFLKLGVQAFIISVFSIVFSVLLVKVAKRYLVKGVKKEGVNNEY